MSWFNSKKIKNLTFYVMFFLALTLLYFNRSMMKELKTQRTTMEWKDEVLKEYVSIPCIRGDFYKFKSQVVESFLVTQNKNLGNFLQELKEVKRVKEIQPLIERYTKQ